MDDLPADLREPEVPALSEAESELARLHWRALKRWDRARRGLAVALLFPVAAGVFLLALVPGSLREGTPPGEWVWDPRRASDAFLLLYPLGLLIALLAAYVPVRLRVGRELRALGQFGVNPTRVLMALGRPDISERRLQRQEALLRRPWWLVELSGAHLIWWTASIMAAWWHVHSMRGSSLTGLLPRAICEFACRYSGPISLIAGLGLMLKLWAPLLMLLMGTGRRELALYYRRWSGWTWPVVIALAPGILHVILTARGVRVT